MKERIIEKTADMFMRYGVRSVTMDDIANRISISKKTIYQHFKDKKEVVKVCMEYLMNQDYEEMMEIQRVSKDSIHEMVLLSVKFREKTKEMNPGLLFDLKKYHPDAWQVYLDMKDRCFKSTIVDALERGKKEGVIREEIDISVIAQMRIAHVEVGFDPEVFSPSEYDIAHVQEQMFTHFVYGVTTTKGQELFNHYLQEIEQQTSLA
ncbi:MAG: TetR/AcrR family transcriptional regulator [Flammeovirgaceae bacterium]